MVPPSSTATAARASAAAGPTTLARSASARKRRALGGLLLLLLLLLVPPVQPQQGGLVESLQIDGPLRLETSTFFTQIESEEPFDRPFALDADRMVVVMERDDATHPSLSTELSNGASSEVIFEGSGRITTDAVRPGHTITLVAQDASAVVESQGGFFGKKPTEKVERHEGYTDERKEEIFNLGPQFRLSEVEGRFIIKGNFSFTLYEWDGIIQYPEGTQRFWTGERHTPLVPLQQVPEDGPLKEVRYIGGRVDWQTAFVYVEQGTLELGISAAKDRASNSLGDSVGYASGSFQVRPELSNGTLVEFEGDYNQFIRAPKANQLSASFSPLVSSPWEDNRVEQTFPAADDPAPTTADSPVLPATTALQAPDAGLPGWIPLLVLPAALLAAVAYVARFRPRRRMKRLEDAFDLSLHAYVLQNAPPLLRSRRFGVEASMMYTVALLDEQGPDEAEAHLRGVRPRSRPTGATYEYLMARIRAAQTRFDEARIHVHACLDEEPAFLIEVRQQPNLRFLVQPTTDPGEGYA